MLNACDLHVSNASQGLESACSMHAQKQKISAIELHTCTPYSFEMGTNKWLVEQICQTNPILSAMPVRDHLVPYMHTPQGRDGVKQFNLLNKCHTLGQAGVGPSSSVHAQPLGLIWYKQIKFVDRVLYSRRGRC